MQLSASLLSFLVLPTAFAANAIIQNNCNYPIYVTSVGSSSGTQQTVTQGNNYQEPYRRDPNTGGIAIKVTRVNGGLFNGSPQFNFQYALDGATVWYDAADVFGDPFSRVEIRPQFTSCPVITWPNGTKPGDARTQACSSDSDIVVTLC